MAIKREKSETSKINVSGVIKEITKDGITIEEKKKDTVNTEVFNLQKELASFKDKILAFTISKTIKGEVTKIDEDGVHVFDEKEEKTVVIKHSDFNSYLEDNVKFSFTETEKEEVESFDE